MRIIIFCLYLLMQFSISLSYSQTHVFSKSVNETLYNLSVIRNETDGSLYGFKKWRYAQAPGIDLVQFDSIGNVVNNIAFNTSLSFATNILPVSSGFVAGTSNLFTHIPTIMKFDDAGNVLWDLSLQYPGGLNAQPVLINELDNEIFTIGSPVTSTPGFNQLFLIISDTSGALNSSISYNTAATIGTFGLVAETFHKLSTGNFLLTGGLLSSCASCFIPYFLFMDSGFNIITSKSVSTSQGFPFNFKFIQKADDSFYLIGSIMSNSPGYLQNGFVINFDSAFNSIWSVYTDNLSLNFGLEFIDASISSSGGLIIGGNYTNGDGWSDFMLLEMDTLGNIVWSTRYGKNSDDEKLISLVNASGDGLYFSGSGYDTSMVSNTVNGLLIKSDLRGNTVCDTSGFLVETNSMNSIFTSETFTKQNIILNSTQVTSPPTSGMTLLSICDGVISSTDENSNSENLNVFPNPARDLVVISGFQFEVNSKISLTDILGKTIYDLNYSLTDNEIIVHTTGLDSGMYILHLTDQQETFSKKIIILD